MATAVQRRKGSPARQRVHIREDFAAATSPLKVDREKGVVYGAKILGWVSRRGRHYKPEAAKRAVEAGRYEGRKSYTDHADKSNLRAGARPVRESLGVWHNVKWQPDGVFGDLHLVTSHPMAASVMEDAEKGLGLYAFSQVADCVQTMESGVMVVHEIEEVQSVDLVSEGATTSNLRESNAMAATGTLTLKQLVESSKGPLKKALARLLEDDYMSGETAVEDEGDWKSHLTNGIAALVKSEDEGDHELAKKILKLMKPASKEEKDEEAEPCDDPEKKKGEEKAMESRLAKLESENAGMKRKDACRTLCESMQITPTPTLLKALVALDNDSDRKALLEESIGSGATRRRSTGPKSGSPAAGFTRDGRPKAPPAASGNGQGGGAKVLEESADAKTFSRFVRTGS